MRVSIDFLGGGPARICTATGSVALVVAPAGSTCILGVGSDGRIGFNEPGSSLASRSRLTTLTAHTRGANAPFFDDDPAAIPAHCLTQSLGTVLEARHALLTATGWHKAHSVHQVAEGPLSAMWPGSVLQLHPHATIIIDRPVASRRQLAAHYETYAATPAW